MMHHRSRAVGLIALIALLVLAPAASAAVSTKAAGGAQAKERAYGKYCGPKGKRTGRAKQRAKCLDAMARLAAGKSSSPQVACRTLSRKKAKGERKSAYARCVSEGAKLLKSKRAKRGGATAGDDEGDWGDDPDSADEGDDLDSGDGALGADDPDDLDPYGDTGADDGEPALDDDPAQG